MRVYTAPSEGFLDRALEHGLWVFVGLEWLQHYDFITASSLYAAAGISLTRGLGEWGRHPAVMGVFVGNEIPADMVRWMGAVNVCRAAGDDVDFCWRLIDAGYGIGFSGGAFVWHRRRTSLRRYFKQQIGYGKAEALLMKKHPHKFKRGCGAEWNGRVYTGGSMTVDAGSVIYHGAMGSAPYQQLALTIQPLRPLMRSYDTAEARAKFRLTQFAAAASQVGALEIQSWLAVSARARG